jgi:2,4-dienoyl-CoA reductase-like NADH-dependent reductase (Old Yellow Enzyme family)
MPQLFENTWIGPLQMSNRAVRSATWSGIGDEEGRVTDRGIAFYEELASGEIGLIITGYQYIMTNGAQLPFMLGNDSEDKLEGLTRLAEAAHRGGGKIVPQIVHAGALANPAIFREGDKIWVPSVVSDSAAGDLAREVSASEIRQLVEAYASAADRSRRAGFDGVQLHAAHGYGINQFLSPFWNKRTDAYGGDILRRYRFLGEVMEAVRGAVGDDFPVLIKLNADDYVEGGLLLEETVKVARFLADNGISAIEVSGGSSASPKKQGPARTKIRSREDEGYFAHLAAAIRDAVDVPVIAVGGIRSFELINDILAAGTADYVAMSRPFIREPHLIKRWKAGDTRRAACISCNGCFETGVAGLGISCKVERELRKKREKEQAGA